MANIREVDLSQTDGFLLAELRGESERLLHRHEDEAKNWYPHTFKEKVYEAQYGGEWSGDNPLPVGVTSALFVNLLTEDNLSYYSPTILNKVPDRDHPLAFWGRRWTAEEGRHSEVIRAFIEASGALDPFKLEDARMAQVSGGVVPQMDSLAELLVYTSWQEEATRIAHMRTGSKLPRSHTLGKKIMARVAGDEALHKRFYEDLALAAFEVDPDTMMIAAAKVMLNFDMPGTGIQDFKMHSDNIAAADIYGARQYVDDVLVPSLTKWDLLNKNPTTPEAGRALKLICRMMGMLGQKARNSAT